MKTIFALLCVLCALCGSTLAEVNSTVDYVSYNGNGSTKTFTVPFGIFSPSTLRVVLRTTATGAEDVQVLNSDFTATDNDSDGDWWDGTPGGSITFTTAPAAGVEVWISRLPQLTQTSDIDGSTYVRLSTIEDAVDKIVTQIQYLRGLSWRSLTAQETDRQVVDMNLPDGWSLSAGYPYWDGDSWGMSSTDLPDTAASAFWGNVLTQTTLAGSVTALGGATEIRRSLALGWHDVRDYGAVGDGVTDDTAAIQAAINAAAAGKRRLLIPPGSYRISSTLTIGTDAAELNGFELMGGGYTNTVLKWYGSTVNTILKINGVSGARIGRICLDGSGVADVNGVFHTAKVGASSSQHVLFEDVVWLNCKGIGYDVNGKGATVDYVRFSGGAFVGCGTGMRIDGGARQVAMWGGSVVNSTNRGVSIKGGAVQFHGSFWGLNGGSDLYLSGEIANVSVFDGKSESLVFLDGDWSNDAGWSRLLAPNIIVGLNQSDHADIGGAAAIDVAVNYDCYRPLTLIGCKFMGDFAVGNKCTAINSFSTDFYNYARRAGEPNAITGFTGKTAVVNLFGRTDNSVGTGGTGPATILAGGDAMFVKDGWLPGIDIRDISGSIYKRVSFSDSEPDTYYAKVGWISYNMNPGMYEPFAWRCITAGDGPAGTTKAVWEPLYSAASGGVEHSYGGGTAAWNVSDRETAYSFFATASASGPVEMVFPYAIPGKVFVVHNACGQTLTVKVTGKTGSTVATSKSALFVMDHLGCIEVGEY